MVTQEVVTVAGSVLQEAVIQEFKASLRGELIRPGDYEYDAARKVWNAKINRHPSMIVRCRYSATPFQKSGSPERKPKVRFSPSTSPIHWARFTCRSANGPRVPLSASPTGRARGTSARWSST